MIEFKYCIKHEHEVVLGSTGAPLGCHWTQDDDLCAGPFTTTPPPEMEEDWDEHLVEPSDEELAVMDASAEDLLIDVLG